MKKRYSLRAIQDEDREFLLTVYASTREDVQQVPWSDTQKRDFVEMQFNAQHAHYMTSFPNARFDVVLVEDVPVGRLYVDVRETEVRVIDVALLDEQRGGGLGTQIMQDVMQEANSLGLPVNIHVLQNNQAQRLYRRLGFTKIGGTEMYDLMEWRPGESGMS